jgi:hypothetical protein
MRFFRFTLGVLKKNSNSRCKSFEIHVGSTQKQFKQPIWDFWDPRWEYSKTIQTADMKFLRFKLGVLKNNSNGRYEIFEIQVGSTQKQFKWPIWDFLDPRWEYSNKNSNTRCKSFEIHVGSTQKQFKQPIWDFWDPRWEYSKTIQTADMRFLRSTLGVLENRIQTADVRVLKSTLGVLQNNSNSRYEIFEIRVGGTQKQNSNNRYESFEIHFGSTIQDRLTNEAVRKSLKVNCLNEAICTYRDNWFNHNTWMDRTRFPQYTRMMSYKASLKRSLGHPRDG